MAKTQDLIKLALPDTEVSLAEAADLFGRTKQWVLDLVKNGHLERVGRGRYRVGDLCAAVVSHFEALREGANASASETRLKDVRAAEVAQRIAIRDRDLIPIDDAIAEQDILVAVCRKEFESLPAAFTRDMAERRRLEKLCDGARTRIADALRVAGDNSRTGKSKKRKD